MQHTGNIYGIEKKVWYLLLLLYIGFLVYEAATLNIWVDEGYTLLTSSNSLPVVIKRSYYFEGQPPFYFVLLAVWRWLNNGILFARLFSIISVLTSAVVFYKLLVLLTQKDNLRYNNWLTALYLFNPFTIWAAVEIRLYAFLLLLTVAAVYFFVLYLQQQKNKHLYYFLLLCLAGIYTQYYFIFLMTGIILAASLIKRDGTFFMKMVLCSVPVVLLLLPNLYFIGRQLGLAKTADEPQGFLSLTLPVWASLKNVLLSMHTLNLPQLVRWCIAGVFAGIIGISLYKNYKEKNYRAGITTSGTFLFAATLVFFLLFLSVFTAYAQIAHVDRYLTIAFPLGTLLFLQIGKQHFFKPIWVYAATLVYFAAVNIASYTKPFLVKKYDYQSISSYITNISKPGEPVLFYHGGVSIPFAYYYKGGNAVVPLPHATVFDSVETDYAAKIKDTAQLSALLAASNIHSKPCLLVTNLTEKLYVNHPEKKLVDDYLNAACKVTLDTLFFGNSKHSALRIRRIEKK